MLTVCTTHLGLLSNAIEHGVMRLEVQVREEESPKYLAVKQSVNNTRSRSRVVKSELPNERDDKSKERGGK